MISARRSLWTLTLLLCAGSAWSYSTEYKLYRQFLRDSHQVSRDPASWNAPDVLALEIRARALFSGRIRGHEWRTRARLIDQVREQADRLVELEIGSASGSAERLRGWCRPGSRRAQSGSECVPSLTETAMALTALYDAARMLAGVHHKYLFLSYQPELAEHYFRLAEQVVTSWNSHAWDEEHSFYREQDLSDDGDLVLSTNSLMGTAHLAGLAAADELRMPETSLAFHREKVAMLSKSMLRDFGLPPFSVQGGAAPLGEHFGCPPRWPHGRSLQAGDVISTDEEDRFENTTHASYTVEFIRRLPEFEPFLPCFTDILFRNVLIGASAGKAKLVCVKKRDLWNRGDLSLGLEETDWWVPFDPEPSCGDGYILTAAFRSHVGEGSDRIDAAGLSRRSSWGWLDLHVQEPQVLSVFLDLFDRGALQALPYEALPSREPFTGKSLFLLAKLYDATTSSRGK